MKRYIRCKFIRNILAGKGNVRVGYGNKKGKAAIARSDSKEARSRRQGRGS